jgi:hypothetical protein
MVSSASHGRGGSRHVCGSDSLARFVQGIAGTVLILLVAEICAGCGGGATAVVQQPQAADFSVALSSNAVSIWQGGVSAPVDFSIIPHNGFSGSVQVTFAGLPAGVSSNPVSPFTITTGIDTSVNFGAGATATTGSFTLSAQDNFQSIHRCVSDEYVFVCRIKVASRAYQFHVVLAFGGSSSGKLATWDASSPGLFKVSPANVSI